MMGDGQAKAGSFMPTTEAAGFLLELVENVREELVFNPYSRVLYRQNCSVSPGGNGHANFPLVGELQRIPDEIVGDPADASLIEDDVWSGECGGDRKV